MSSPRIRVSRAGREQVKDLAIPLCKKAARRIADKCNDQSSWTGPEKSPGGYVSIDDARVGVVFALTHAADADNSRTQRLLRNVSAGKDVL